MRKKAVVTGARGFIGTHLVDELVKRYEVIATDLAIAPRDFLNSKATFISLDFTDKGRTVEFFKLPVVKNAELLFHLGAIFDFWPLDSVMFKNNSVGTENIFNGFKKLESPYKRFILYSSGAVYGDTSSAVSAGENFPANPKSAYARSKWEQEKILEKLCGGEIYSENVIIRPGAVIGPRSRYGAAKIMEFIATGQLQFFLGKKNLIASLVHVEDMVNATIYLAECNWHRLKMITGSEVPVFNVVDNSRYTIEELVSYVADLLKETHGAGIIPIHLPVWMLKPIVRWQEYLAKKHNSNPKLTEGLLDFFEAPMTMNNFLLKAAGFNNFKYPDTKEAIKETINWYLKEGWI